MYDILLVEDDVSVRTALASRLTDRGLQVAVAATAMEALRSITACPPNLVVLDLGLPDLDGAAVLRMVRGVSNVPVIVATARGHENSVVSLLNAGADDYVVKPFSSEQLLARIGALLRRANGCCSVDDEGLVEVGGLRIDRRQRTAELDGNQLTLHRLEFDLLSYLVERRDTVVTRDQLFRDVWRQQCGGEDQTIDVHVSWLRRKLGETAADPRYLHTIRGAGFKLTAPE